MDGAAFYCQQATEKSLKYILVMTKKESYPIHSLIKLGKLVGVPKEFEDFLKNLTKEYYLSRYPDVTEDAPFEMYDQIEVSNVVKKTKEFLRWINMQMKK